MKTIIKSSLIILITLVSTNFASAQEAPTKKVETAEFTVSGTCNMCKKRIENAALIKGVKYAKYDKREQLLKVVYKTSKTTLEEIQAAVAEKGHDTDLVKASDESYSKLPACCAYRDDVEVH